MANEYFQTKPNLTARADWVSIDEAVAILQRGRGPKLGHQQIKKMFTRGNISGQWCGNTAFISTNDLGRHLRVSIDPEACMAPGE